MKQFVYFISDGTGITVETLGHTLLTQFDHLDLEQVTIPYVNTANKALEVIQQIKQTHEPKQRTPLIFATLINPEIRTLFQEQFEVFIEFFSSFINPLEKVLGAKSSHHIGRSHSLVNYESYKARIDAINFTLNCDDGANVHQYAHADVILVGVSRCGKTPTSIYLALQFGIHAANYPFTQDDMEGKLELPDFLAKYKDKLFGLTIDSKRLHHIRTERRANSVYASLEQCQAELKKIENLFKSEDIPFLDTTHHSIEEISTTILAKMGLKRRLF